MEKTFDEDPFSKVSPWVYYPDYTVLPLIEQVFWIEIQDDLENVEIKMPRGLFTFLCEWTLQARLHSSLA